MILVNLQSFLPNVMPYANGVPEPHAINALRDAAITYCQRTRCWKQWIDPPATATEGDPEVVLNAPADSAVWEVEELWLDRNQLEPLTEDAIRHRLPSYLHGDRGAVVLYTHETPGVVRLVRTPDRTYTQLVRARVTLMPTRTATTVPDFLYRDAAREIGDGALAHLHATAEAYARPDAQQFYQAKFEAAIDVGISRAARSNTRARRRVMPHFF